jgi:hypothetical protein
VRSDDDERALDRVPLAERVYTETMQKIATRIFIGSSVFFGLVGLTIVLTASGPDTPDTRLDETLIRLLFGSVFVILPSFALSLAGKYLIQKP